MGLLVAAAAVLLGVARAGVPPIVFYLALAGYFVAAVYWIRTQYLDSRDGQMWVLSAKAIVGAVVWLAILVPVASRYNSSLAALFALYVFWLAGSAVLTRLRNTRTERGDGFFKKQSTRAIYGLITTGAGLLLVLAGVDHIGSRIGRSLNIGVLVAAVVGVFAMLAVGVNLLSESAIRRQQRQSVRRITILGVLGVVGLLGAGSIAPWLSKTPEVWLVFVALFVLMVATASRTHADAVILMALVAVLGVTPEPEPKPDAMTESASLRNLLSPSSPWGIPTSPARVRRSTTKGPHAAEMMPPSPNGLGGRSRQTTPVRSLLILGLLRSRHGQRSSRPVEGLSRRRAQPCWSTGLRTNPDRDDPTTRLIGPQENGGNMTQLDQWVQQRDSRHLKPTMVAVSLGGNDAGFATIGATCVHLATATIRNSCGSVLSIR